MKITHNRVGQNLNVVDGVQQGKTESSKEAGKKNNVKPTASPIDSGAAKLDFSPKAQEAKRIKDLAMAAPDVDQEKVNRLKRLIDEGKYKVDARAVADKMVDEHLETGE